MCKVPALRHVRWGVDSGEGESQCDVCSVPSLRARLLACWTLRHCSPVRHPDLTSAATSTSMSMSAPPGVLTKASMTYQRQRYLRPRQLAALTRRMWRTVVHVCHSLAPFCMSWAIGVDAMETWRHLPRVARGLGGSYFAGSASQMWIERIKRPRTA